MPFLTRYRRLFLLRDQRGTSMVEFAFAAPFLGLMLVGIADYGRGFSERFALQSAANRVIERANLPPPLSSTTTATTSSADYSFLQAEAAAAANVPISNVTYTQELWCDDRGPLTFDDVCDSTEQIARYVKIRIEKDFVPSFSWNGGTVRIAGEAAVRIQ